MKPHCQMALCCTPVRQDSSAQRFRPEATGSAASNSALHSRMEILRSCARSMNRPSGSINLYWFGLESSSVFQACGSPCARIESAGSKAPRRALTNRNATSMTRSEQGRPSPGQAVEMYDDISKAFSAPVGNVTPGGSGIQACCNVRQMILIWSSIGKPSVASCGPSRVRQRLLDPGSIYKATQLPDLSAQRRLVAGAAEIGKNWPDLPGTRQRAVLTALIARIEVGADQIDIHLRATRLGALLDVATPLRRVTEDATQILSVSIRLRRAGREITMRIAGTDPFATAKPDARLIRLLIRARRFNATLVGGDGVPFAALAKRDGVSPSYFTRLVRLSYLAPDITQAILEGRQPYDLTADQLLAHSRLPLAWHEQRTLLGFG